MRRRRRVFRAPLADTTLRPHISLARSRYVAHGVVFVGSKLGDSALVKLAERRDARTGSYLEPIEQYASLAPITHMCVVGGGDGAGRGAGAGSAPHGCEVVTCSGAGRDGSLRVVRNGIGVNEQAEAEIAGIKGLWPLRASGGAAHDTCVHTPRALFHALGVSRTL